MNNIFHISFEFYILILLSLGSTVVDLVPVLHDLCVSRPPEVGRWSHHARASSHRYRLLQRSCVRSTAIAQRRPVAVDNDVSVSLHGREDIQPEIQHGKATARLG